MRGRGAVAPSGHGSLVAAPREGSPPTAGGAPPVPAASRSWSAWPTCSQPCLNTRESECKSGRHVTKTVPYRPRQNRAWPVCHQIHQEAHPDRRILRAQDPQRGGGAPRGEGRPLHVRAQQALHAGRLEPQQHRALRQPLLPAQFGIPGLPRPGVHQVGPQHRARRRDHLSLRQGLLRHLHRQAPLPVRHLHAAPGARAAQTQEAAGAARACGSEGRAPPSARPHNGAASVSRQVPCSGGRSPSR